MPFFAEMSWEEWGKTRLKMRGDSGGYIYVGICGYAERLDDPIRNESTPHPKLYLSVDLQWALSPCGCLLRWATRVWRLLVEMGD